MNTTQIYKFLLIIFLTFTLLSLAAAAAEEPIDYYAPENVRKFADFLYEQGDYLRATGEYQRYLFYQPQESEQIRYRIALCYRFAGQSEQAIQNFQMLLRGTSRRSVCESCLLSDRCDLFPAGSVCAIRAIFT